MSEVDQIDPIDKLAGLIQTHVAGGGSVAGFARDFGPHFDPELLKAARARYERSVGLIRELKDPAVLVDEKLKGKDWYGGPKSGDIFWPGLKGKLEPSLPAAALVSVDESSSKILNLMTPPGSLSIRTRGLVLGHVQSGKTTSFMSVAAKAADVGYRLIIVLSGITDNLRSQTQDRLEEQLVGDDSKHKWIRLTTLDYDFQAQVNAAAQLTSDQHRLLAVVKKNPYRLRRLAEWLESAGEAALRSCPILIIDDEADQASIDVGKTRVSTINKLIRRILDSPKAAYVAYTATPFANLLIDPAEQEGLYPRNFIVNLPAGGDYYGPERLFGRNLLDHVEDDRTAEPDDVIRKVPDADIPAVQPPKGKGAVAHWQPEVAPSMAAAINWFVLATAARWARGHTGAHSSMLIHTSMLADAHFLLKGVVDEH
ncbi:MAG: alpha-1,4 polygalactosaminidase, partial [Comamonadaceae bacterium]